MYTLFYSPGACSMAAHILLEEIGLPYNAEKVDLKSHTLSESGKDFYQINPQGAVPALLLEDGSLLSQNLAILIYLGEQDKNHQLLPPANTLEYIRCIEWLGFVNSDLHKGFGSLFKVDSWVSTETAKAELKQNLEKNAKKLLLLVEKKLKPQGYALGENFSVVDAYLFVILQWTKYMNIPMNDCPNLTALGQRITQRPGVQRMLKQEGLVR